MKVVCLKDNWRLLEQRLITDTTHPRKGEMYEAMHAEDGFLLINGFRSQYHASAFREVDNTFGHVVCETIEQQIAYAHAQE